MSEEVQLKCDTFNDKNTYYVIDGNLGIEHELHGSVQFRVVDENGKDVYKSHTFSVDYFIQQFKMFEKEQWDKHTRQFSESLKKSIENDTCYFLLDGEMVKLSELNRRRKEGL